VPVYESHRDLIEHTAPQLLVVATHPESHYRITRDAARAGVPVVICEKPIARSLREARAIARIHRRAVRGDSSARVLVNHERRYSEDYIEARRAVSDGRYGELLSVKGTLCFGSRLPRREVLLHDGTHLVDIVNFLSGQKLRLRRRFGSMRSAEKSAFLFGTAGAAPVCIEVGSQRDHLIFEIELGFRRGRIRVGNGVYEFRRSAESPFYEGYRSLLPDPEAPSAPEKTNYFSGMVADAVRCLRDPEHLPFSSAEDGLEVMRFIRSVRAFL
jgi:predicted dehydrogenase